MENYQPTQFANDVKIRSFTVRKHAMEGRPRAWLNNTFFVNEFFFFFLRIAFLTMWAGVTFTY